MPKFKKLIEVIKDTFNGFIEHKIFKMSASLSYTTVFSMAPLLIVILYLFEHFFNREALEGIIFSQAKEFIGNNAALQLQTMIQQLSISKEGNFAGTIGFITLIVGATSVFAEIQDSINTIWGIRPKIKSSFLLYLKSRLLSFGVIGSLGFILLVSLGFSSILEYLKSELFVNLSTIGYIVFSITDFIITSLIITLLFGSIFTILPDAEISWKQVKVASITTTLLFMIGKYVISYYISNSNVSSAYGAAGSFVVLMLWVYYSSVIFYFGAEFSKCYAVKFSKPIVPSEFAEIVQTVNVSSKTETIDEAKEEKKDFQTVEDIKKKPKNI